MILPLGPYQIIAGAEGYRDSSQMLYVSRQVQEVVFVLGKEPQPPMVVLAEPQPEPVP